MQRLSDEQNKNRYETCERSSWEIESRLYRSLNNPQIENQFIINSSIDVVIDTTPDATSFGEFTQAYRLILLSFYRIHDVFHVFYLKSYKRRKSDNNISEFSFSELVNDENISEVKKILKKKIS